jgi:hypothetical protein
MSRTRTLLFSALAVLAIAGAAANRFDPFSATTTTPGDRIVPDHAVVSPPTSDTTDLEARQHRDTIEIELAVLRDELRRMRAAQSEIGEGFDLVIEELGRTEATDRGPESTREDAPESSTREVEQRREAEDWTVSTAATLQQRVQQEPADPGWKADAEARITQEAGSLVTDGATLEEANCAASVCRVSVRFPSEQEFLRRASSVSDLDLWPGSRFAFQDPRDPLRMVVYVGREGADLGF